MSKTITIDPVTRIEGHLRIEVNIDESNIIRNAVSTGTMWRGLEVILKGRDPRDAWAFTQRICGVCTGTHALTSVRAVEAALGIETERTDGTLFKGRVPPLGSHYAFELHEIADGEYAVRLTFNSSEDSRPITIPGCDGEMCSLDSFMAMAREVVPRDWRQACTM